MDSERSFNLWAIGKWLCLTALVYWAKVPYLVQILVAFMALDMVTGLLAAFVRKEICSEIGARGVAKKVLMLILVAVAHVISDKDPLHLGIDLGNVVALGYLANEVISIVENCAWAGIPVPGPLVDALMKFKGQGNPGRK